MKFNVSVHFLLTTVLFLTSLVLAQGTRYAVQLGALQSQTDADAKVNELRAKDVQAYIVRTFVPGKGTFYRIRVGMFADTNAAKKYGADLVRRGVTADFFVAPFEQPLEEKTVAIKPISKPTPASAPVNTPATTATLDNTTLASSPPKQTSPETA